ncbi:MarR family transcriptional regulator [Nocardia stercoris]|uniref:MarR family transcriptional regulator n=2 Tax=Nocardia stercoris TaxID=2483361 RepID=A0A3M2KXI6_9NOCA|nr:MarR family transcriptional regulator [Nocardia stercoris]
MDTQLQREAGMTHFEYLLLTALAEQPNRKLQLSELAARANASLSRLSHVVTKLERVGWVRREALPGRRGAHAVLTESGYAKAVAAAPGYLAAVRGLVFDGFDRSEVEQLSTIADAIIAQLEAGQARGIGRTGGNNLQPGETTSR